jgi:hypothetical protein
MNAEEFKKLIAEAEQDPKRLLPQFPECPRRF